MVRNITGKYEAFHDLSFIWPTDYRGAGAISVIAEEMQYRYSEIRTTDDSVSLGFSFSANDGDITTTPMSGHAVGSEIKPYSVSSLILISY